MIPQTFSGDTFQDSEPFLTVDQDTPWRMVASAFTLNPNGANRNTAPVFVTTDTGNTWTLRNIVSSRGWTRDITVGAARERDLHAGILLRPTALGANTTQSIQRTDNYLQNNVMNVASQRNNPDQPYIQVPVVNDTERIYVGTNDMALRPGATATIDFSNDGGQTYNSLLLERRNPAGQDAPSVRPAIAGDGTVYAAFARYRSTSGSLRFWDLTVVRDDNWGNGGNPFADLTDPSDNQPGKIVDSNRPVQWQNNTFLGQERTGSHLALAVNPEKSGEVYLSWTDTVGNGVHNLHLRRSADRGETWSEDLLTLSNVTAHSIAVADNGTAGLLVHQLITEDGQNRWRCQLIQSKDKFETLRRTTLANVPANNPVFDFLPYLGDYNCLVAVGDLFRGVFSASNIPDEDNFPNGVTYQRNADFQNNTLDDGAGNNVQISIDPFYFTVSILKK